MAGARVNSRRLAGWSELKNTCFLNFGQLFNFQSTHFFFTAFICFLTTIMVVITYVTTPTYKYSSKLPHFLTSSHILTLLLTLSPYKSPSIPSFFSIYFGVKRG